MALFLLIIHLTLLAVFAANVVYLRRRASHPPAPTFPPGSVLIPARNEANNLPRLLGSLHEQDYPDFEIVVYDDGSADETPEVLRRFASPRLITLRGEGPPAGWVGKVHALYQATRQARGSLFLFLDADTELHGADALRRLVDDYAALPAPSVMTVLPRFRGGGMALVSIVPNAILTGLPWPLVRRVRSRSLGALNGQCWVIDAASYRQHEPHRAVAGEILEDVAIGRYLKERGVIPYLIDANDRVSVHMYADLRDAWAGFQKNAYLLFGGTVPRFALLTALFILTYVAAPFVDARFLVLIYLNKLLTDRWSGIPLWVSAIAPLSFILAATLQIDSARSHLTGRVRWKGRSVGP